MTRWVAAAVVLVVASVVWASRSTRDVWVSDTEGAVVWKLTSKLGVRQKLEGFRCPTWIEATSDGGFWLVDNLQDSPPCAEIFRLSSGGVRRFAVAGFRSIAGLAVGEDGEVWVADKGEDLLSRLSGEGRVLESWPFESLSAVTALHESSRVAVASTSGCIGFFRARSSRPLVWQTGGRPVCVRPARGGGLWWLDGDYPRALVRLDSSGTELLRFPTYSSAKRFEVDPASGNVWVGGEGWTRCFSEDGDVLEEVECPGETARVLAVDEESRCWVATEGELRVIGAKGVLSRLEMRRAAGVGLP